MRASAASQGEASGPGVPPRGLTAMGIFLFFGAAMACFAGVTLIWRGTPLGGLWKLNVRAHEQLTSFPVWIGVPFLLLSAALFAAGLGWFRRQPWGWVLAATIIAIQAAGDIVNVFRGDILPGTVGAGIAGALLAWLFRRDVRASFGSGRNAP